MKSKNIFTIIISQTVNMVQDMPLLSVFQIDRI